MTIPIFVIGMESGYRGKPLEDQLTSAELSFTRIHGVHGSFKGRPIDDYVDQKRARLVYGHTLSTGEIGCALAHRAVYEKFIDTGHSWALVLEDDARIRDIDSLMRLMTWIEERKEIGPRVLACYARAVLASRRTPVNSAPVTIHRLLITPFTTTAYLINASAARLFLEEGLPLVNPADWPMSTEGRVGYFAVYPWPISPDEVEGSSVGGRIQQRGGRFSRLWDRILTLSHVRWALNRDALGPHRSYWSREVKRFVLQRLAGRGWPYEVPSTSVAPPTANRVTEFAAMLLSPSDRTEL